MANHTAWRVLSDTFILKRVRLVVPQHNPPIQNNIDVFVLVEHDFTVLLIFDDMEVGDQLFELVGKLDGTLLIVCFPKSIVVFLYDFLVDL